MKIPIQDKKACSLADGFRLPAHRLGDEIDTRVLAFRRRGPTGSAIVDAMPDELRFILRSGGVTVSGNVSAHGRPVPHTLKVVGTTDSVELDYTSRTLIRASRWSAPTMPSGDQPAASMPGWPCVISCSVRTACGLGLSPACCMSSSTSTTVIRSA